MAAALRQADGPRGVVFCRVKGARDEQSQVAKFVSQGFSGNAQQAGGFLLIALRILQDARQEEPVHLTVGFGVEVLHPGRQPLADESFQAEVGTAPGAAGRGPLGVPVNSGRKAGRRIGPLARSKACFRTLCSSRILPGQE